MPLINLGPWDMVKPEDWPWSHFTTREMRHRPDGDVWVDREFMDKLEDLRVAYDKPMPVTSYFRSPVYNSQVSSTGLTGPHTTGRAVDIKVSGYEAAYLTSCAVDHGFTGFGWQQKGDGRFLHIDMLAPRSWSY